LAVVTGLLSPNFINGTTSILGKRKRQGANIEAKDNAGNTPLHDASWNGHLPVVKALRSGGANILARTNYEGLLPIHQAVSEGNSAVAKYLLQQLYATTRRHPLHELLEYLSCIGNPDSTSSEVPPLSAALDQDVLGTDDVVEILVIDS
jgi:ankyrin repeat protein